MPVLSQTIAALIRNHRLLEPGESCIVAVSGGPDSMALLHILADIGQGFGTRLIVAHFDHGLRPDEAPAEAELTRQAAARLALPFEYGKADTRDRAGALGLSLEHAARDLRYAFLRECARRHACRQIAVGHTADDQAEEILLRLIRGSGRAGLSGMALEKNGVIRPLLETGKQELLDYLAAQGIDFLEDSSNRSRIHLRNRIRMDLLPFLAEQFNPNIRTRLRRTADILAAEEALLDVLTEEVYPLVASEKPGDPPSLSLDRAAFFDQPLALGRRILEKACWRLRHKPSFDQIERLRTLLEAARPGSRLHLAGGLRAQILPGRLLLHYPMGRGAIRGECLAEPLETEQAPP